VRQKFSVTITTSPLLSSSGRKLRQESDGCQAIRNSWQSHCRRVTESLAGSCHDEAVAPIRRDVSRKRFVRLGNARTSARRTAFVLNRALSTRHKMRTTRSGSEKGRPRRKRSWIKTKDGSVHANTERQCEHREKSKIPVILRSWRRANFRSFNITRCVMRSLDQRVRPTSLESRKQRELPKEKRADAKINSWIDSFGLRKG